MSEEKDFLHFLLTTLPDQQKALLQTVTPEQTHVLVEVAYNLTRLTDLGNQQKFIAHVGKQSHTLRYKRSLIRRYATRLLKVLNAHKEKLLEL